MSANNPCALGGLGHIGVFVKDAYASKAFYESLGFITTEIYPRKNGKDIVFVTSGSCVVELITSMEDGYAGRPAGAVDHICVETSDIEKACAFLKSINADDLGGISEIPGMSGGIKNVFFRGPDGERLELVQFLNK